MVVISGLAVFVLALRKISIVRVEGVTHQRFALGRGRVRRPLLRTFGWIVRTHARARATLEPQASRFHSVGDRRCRQSEVLSPQSHSQLMRQTRLVDRSGLVKDADIRLTVGGQSATVTVGRTDDHHLVVENPRLCVNVTMRSKRAGVAGHAIKHGKLGRLVRNISAARYGFYKRLAASLHYPRTRDSEMGDQDRDVLKVR